MSFADDQAEFMATGRPAMPATVGFTNFDGCKQCGNEAIRFVTADESGWQFGCEGCGGITRYTDEQIADAVELLRDERKERDDGD